MRLLKRTLALWIPLAGLTTITCLLVYLVGQQIFRQLANDPQIQMARDAQAALGVGQAVDKIVPAAHIDIGTSLATFVTLLDDRGGVVASSGYLGGQPRTVPAGVLNFVQVNGEERISWQPEPGVRVAAVVERLSGARSGFIVVGRSLRESEERTAKLRQIVGLAWVVALPALLLLVALSDYAFSDRRPEPQAGGA